MDLNIFKIANHDWIKRVGWAKVSFVVFITTAMLLFSPNFILVDIGLVGFVNEYRCLIGILFILSASTTIVCLIPAILLRQQRWIKSFEWKGKRAKEKIRTLSPFAQERVRENYERKAPLCFMDNSKEHIELLAGNFLLPLSVDRTKSGNSMKIYRLNDWVVRCFKRYPTLINELQESSEEERAFV